MNSFFEEGEPPIFADEDPAAWRRNTVSRSQPEVARKDALKIKTVLVPMDFSAASMQALDYAVPIAEQFNSSIHLLYVQERDQEFLPAAGASHILLECAATRTQLRRQLAGIQSGRPFCFHADNSHIRSGRAYRKTCQLAREIDADLIVVASRGQTGLPRVLLGSTAEQIVRHAPCPVLVARQQKQKRRSTASKSVRRDSQFSIRRIMVPVDFSDCAIKAVKYAASFAKQCGAQVHVFHAVFPHDYLLLDRSVCDPSVLREAELTSARKHMEVISRLDCLRGIVCENAVRTGYPVREICRELDNSKIDLVITSTHGQTGPKRVLVGSVAEHIVRYAQCPVLVIPRAFKNKTK
jgi:nucleotide-binding universal stress UspA family protein